MKNVRPKRILVKISLIFIFCFIIMLVLSSVILNYLSMGAIQKIEDIDVNADLSTIQNAVHNKLNYLETLAVDWSVWDDTYQYVQDANEEYTNSNLPDSNFDNLNLSLIMMMDDSGKIIYGKMVALNTDTVTDVSDTIKTSLSKLNVLNNTNPDYYVQGIIMLPEGPMLIASHSVLKSDNSGPSKGNLVFGRYFDDSVLKDLSNSLNLQISAAAIGTKEFAQMQKTNSNEPAMQIAPVNSDFIKGTEYIPDLFHQSALQLSVTVPRDIYKAGQTNTMVTSITLIIMFFVIILLLWILINKFVLSRISKLHKDVTSITVNKNLSQRVTMQGDYDEIYGLSANINSMLDVGEELNTNNQKANYALEQKTAELVQLNEALTAEKEKIQHMAFHDSLTGLPNGSYFNDFLNRAIFSANRIGKPLAVLFIDLDGFKMVNDTLGHAAGDKLLISVANRLNAILRKSDFIARIGGDEFIILIDNIKDNQEINIIASKILKKLAEPFIINDQECFISASIGISLYPIDGNNAEELTKNADLAMYNAKDNGKNKHCFCNQEMKDQVIENMMLSNQLWRASAQGEFELYYQPQINCTTGKIAGMEALIRWNHTERGMVLPGKFISLAEQTGAIIPIGEWVLTTACMQCKAWQDKYSSELRMAVNVSIKQLQDDGIVQQVEDILQNTGLAPSKLELEVTESIFMKEVDFVIDVLNKLSNLGVNIAIDDFGTEYASMNYLKQMPVNRIKIAMPFIQGLDENEKDRAITKALIILAKQMGMSVIAEGVETKTQYNYLMQKLCDETQGFYFYQPMPVKEMEEVLKKQFLQE